MITPTTDPRIIQVEGTAMAVNSYVVDGPDGLVIVDGQLTVSDARAVRQVTDQIGRPIAGLVVTHPHPDHYAGAATILDGVSAPIIATQAVATVIERDDAEKNDIVAPMMGDEWPTTRRFPDEIISHGEPLRLGGLTFEVTDLGAAESHADTMFTLDGDVVFSGDVASNDAHAYLLDGHHVDWLDTLARLERELPSTATLYGGHGAPTDTSILGRQAAYVRAFVDVVAEFRDASEQERHDAVVERMQPMVGDDRLLFLMELSIEPVLATLSRSEVRDGRRR